MKEKSGRAIRREWLDVLAYQTSDSEENGLVVCLQHIIEGVIGSVYRVLSVLKLA